MKRVLLFTSEVAAVAALGAGVALIYIPAALILVGILGVVAAERAITKFDKAKAAKK